MTRYVDDLTKVRPEEIQHIAYKKPIIAIVHCPKTVSPYSRVVVIWEDGETGFYTLDGYAHTKSERCFIYKPKKVLYLKSLHKILEENEEAYEVDEDGSIYCVGIYIIAPTMFQFLDRPWEDRDSDWDWDKGNWTEWREV